MTEEAQAGNQSMTIKILGQDGREIQIRIKSTTPFKKIFAAYCERTGIPPEVARFVYDGFRVRDTDTPAHIEMEDGDTIEAFYEQTGGSITSHCLKSSFHIQLYRRLNNFHLK